jgi:hypothetical protein
MHPGPYHRAIRSVVADLAATRDGTTYLGTSIAGLRQRYDLGSEHDLVGRSAPDVVLADGRRVAGFPILEYWLDIGQPADYIRAEADSRAARVGPEDGRVAVQP